jgi:hypothetical protein
MNRVNYVSLYETVAGVYQITFLVIHQTLGSIKKTIRVLVVPSRFESIQIEEQPIFRNFKDGSLVKTSSEKVKAGIILSVEFFLLDRFGNNVLELKGVKETNVHENYLEDSVQMLSEEFADSILNIQHED